MGKMPNKKLKIGPESAQSSGEAEMEQLINHGDGEGLAYPAINFVGLGVFPEEIWLQVLDNLTHSPDILNVLKAFPELDKAFHHRKAFWLFDQVLPHLMTKHLVMKKNEFDNQYVDSDELLKLRLISKRWKMIVESSIQNHADRHPINSENQWKSSAASVALPLNHFNYNRINKYHLGANVFRTIRQIDHFLNQMADFQWNPFPGKYVSFEIDDDTNDNCQELAMKAAELLQKFGQHVLFLDWHIEDGSECHLELCKVILKGLSSTPNLQSLKLFGNVEATRLTGEAGNEYFSKAESLELFPKLENLESCDLGMNVEPLGDGKSVWVERLIEFYGGGAREQKGLRKLALDLKDWNVEMVTNLKNLTELHLQYLTEMKGYNVGDVGNVLRVFPSGQLKKFCFSDNRRYGDYGDAEVYIDELIGMLAEFQIENVAFENLALKEKTSEMEAMAITSLHLDDSLGLSYEFLKRLPNLRFLSVYVDSRIVNELAQPDGETDEDSFAFKIRQYFWNVDRSFEWKGDRTFDIWKECGKLEMLTVYVLDADNDVFDVRFVREHGNKPFWGWNESDEEVEDEEVDAEEVEDGEVDAEEVEDEEVDAEEGE